MRSSLLGFLFDPGWPFVLAGILMLLSAGLIPSEIELEDRELDLAALRAERDRHQRLHEAYGGFLDEIGVGDPSLAKRLTGAQLWLIPETHEPVTIIKTHVEAPSLWIERAADSPAPWALAAEPSPPEASGMRQSTLATLLEGSGRLWIFGGALVSIFLGLLLGTPTPRAGADDELNGLEPAA